MGERVWSEKAAALRHRSSRRGIVSVWRGMAQSIYSARVLNGLPRYAAHLAKQFWSVDGNHVIEAIRIGDVAFFVCFALRLDQIECAMLDKGWSDAERAPLVHAKFVIDGFRQAAQERLELQGGKWPPVDSDVG